ncbi:MAG: 50S ribosomal protein L32 [Deltaproteobacteria bacterium]|nr:50S ribosomal protein L32 [Deltaproteobacteria bacterium]
MAVPKKRQSRSRRNKRRANHDRTTAPTIVECSNCSEPKLPHRVCPSCGHYKGTEVLQMEDEE